MQWEARKKPEEGQCKIVNRFMWWPHKIRTTWYWLEMVGARHVYVYDKEKGTSYWREFARWGLRQ